MITAEFVIDHFPQYNKYFLDEDGVYDSEVLADEIAMSEAELTEYVDVNDSTITDILIRHLLNIVKYRGFVRVHGDTEFEHKPQIVKDYEATVMKIQQYKLAKESPSGTAISHTGMVSITSKTRRFDEWFNEPEAQTDTEA